MEPLKEIKLDPPTAAIVAEAQTVNAGWWSIRGLSGSREGILKAIDDSKGVPEHWKASLKAEVNSLAPENNFVRLDASCMVEKGHKIYQLHILGSSALL